MSLALAILQLVSAQAPAPQPDIELNARVRMREVAVRQSGDGRIAVQVEPGEAPPVKVQRSAPAGAQRYRNLTIDLRAHARIVDPFTSQQGNKDEDTPP